MNAGNKDDRLFFIIQPVSLLPLYDAAKRSNIKEDIR